MEVTLFSGFHGEKSMADELMKTGGQDRKRINMNQDFEVRDWSTKFGVSKDELKKAVEAVGNEALKVEGHCEYAGIAVGRRIRRKD